MMVAGHEKELAKIDANIAKVENAELADSLKATKPVLQHHADEARTLQSNMPTSTSSTTGTGTSGTATASGTGSTKSGSTGHVGHGLDVDEDRHRYDRVGYGHVGHSEVGHRHVDDGHVEHRHHRHLGTGTTGTQAQKTPTTHAH